MHEPLPDRLIAAARGERGGRAASRAAQILPFNACGAPGGAWCRRWWIGLPIAASIVRPARRRRRRLSRRRQVMLARRALAGRAGDRGGSRRQSLARQRRRLFQAVRQRRRQLRWSTCRRPATRARRCKRSARACRRQVRLPDLKPWGLNFRGARLDRRRRPSGSPARLHDRQQGDRAVGPDHRVLEAAGHTADLRAPPGRQPALLAASRSRLRPRRPGRTSAICGASATTSPGSSTRSDGSDVRG